MFENENEIDFNKIDFSTPERAREAVSKALTHLRAAREQGEAVLKAELDKVKADLSAAVEAARTRPTLEQPENFRAFQRADGSLRLYSEDDADGGGEIAGLLDHTGKGVDDWHEDVLRAMDDYAIARVVSRGGAPKSHRRLAKLLGQAPDSLKKLPVGSLRRNGQIVREQRAFGDLSGQGAEWYPDPTMPMVERELKLERKVAALFDERPAPAKNFYLPTWAVAGAKPYKKGAVATNTPAQYTASDVATGRLTYDITGMAVRVVMDEEAEEDAILPAMQFVREGILDALRDGEEDAILNGDTAGSHQDAIASWNLRSRWGASGLGGTDDHRRCWMGLRARAVDVSATVDGSAAQTYAGFLATRKLLASPHSMSDGLVCITSLEYYLGKMHAWDEVLTLEKFGPNASILTGQVGAIGGVPIVLSDFMGADLNNSGLYDGSTTDKTGLLIVDRRRFVRWMRRGITLEADKDVTRGIYNMVATVRSLFATVDGASKKNVAYAYKLTS